MPSIAVLRTNLHHIAGQLPFRRFLDSFGVEGLAVEGLPEVRPIETHRRIGAGAHRIHGREVVLLNVRRAWSRARLAMADGLHLIVSSNAVRERAMPLAVAGLVVVASAISVNVGGTVAGGTGSTGPLAYGPRLAVGGGVSLGGDNGGVGAVDPGIDDRAAERVPVGLLPEFDARGEDTIDGPFLDDGALVMPVGVNTKVADGSVKLRKYRVRSGDTLTGIAHHFGVSMMSIWWANDLTSKNKLHIGQTLVIPPVSGLVVTVKEGDTLASVAKRTDASVDEIVSYNGLTDTNLVIGQKLIIPGALGKGIPIPKPSTKSGGSSSSVTYRAAPSTYGGGAFAWPVPGGSISQYFHYGHPALDIQAPYGTRVNSAAAGTVVFAGWNDNGGGYQVWVAHGSGLYTTYNHMSAITVGTGERVGRGSQVGRIGQSGWATGPHLHFEVWRGYPWRGGSYRVNPLSYL